MFSIFRNLSKNINQPNAMRTTFFRVLEPLHNALTDRSPHYRNWHALPYVSVIHSAIIITSVFVTIAIMLALIFSSPRVAQSAALTWDGGGSTNNWSECTNWTTDACPTSADSVTFNATSTKDATVDASFGGVVTSVIVASGYSGTITLDRSLNTTTSFGLTTGTTGTVTVGSQTLDVDTNLSIISGTLNASSNTLFIGRDLTITSGTFNHNNGTVTFDGGSTGTFSCNNATFNSVTFNQAANASKSVGSNCSFPLGANPTIPGNTSLAGTFSGSGTFTESAGTFTLNGGTLSGFTGFTVAAFQVSSGSYSLGDFSPVSISSTTTISGGTLTTASGHIFTSNMTVSGGTFNAPTSGTVQFNGALTISSGTFNHNNGTVIFGGTTTATLSCNNTTFNAVSFIHVNNPKTVSSNCSFPLGSGPTIGGPLTLNGTFTGTGTITYASTLTWGSTGAMTGFGGVVVGSTFNLNGGTADLGSYTTADFNGAFTLTSGTFTAPSGTMTLASGFTYTAGTFTHNSGTVVLDGTGGGTINCGTVSFNIVQFNHSSSAKTISAGCTLSLGADPTSTGSITLNGTLSGTGTFTQSTNNLQINSGGSLSGFTGFSRGTAGNMIIAGATADFSTYSSFSVNGFFLNSGSFSAPNSMQVLTTFTGAGGTFTHNNGTVEFTSGGTTTCGGVTFYRVAITHPSSTRTFSGCPSVPLGTDPASIYQTTLTNSTLTGSGSLTIHGLLTVNAGSGISGFDQFIGNNTLSITGGDVDFGNFTNVDLNNTFSLASGSFTAPSSGAMTVATTMTFSGGSFTANGGTVTVDGATGTLTCNNATFNRVVFSHTNTKTVSSNCSMPLGENPTVSNSIVLNGTLSGSGTLTTTAGTLSLNSGSSVTGFSRLVTGSHLTINGATFDAGSMSGIDVNGNFTLSSGTFTAPTGTMTVGGNWTNSGGTFNHNNGTIELDGGSQAITGANTFYHFTKTITSRYYLNFPANTTQTILGNLTLHGTGGKNLLVRSSTSGSRFSIDPRGNRDISFIDLKDANNVNGTRINIAGTSSYNAGNNTGWSFYAPGVTNLGSAGLRDGSYTKSTQPTFSFDTSDQDSSDGDTIKYQIQIDDSSDYGSTLVDYTSSLAAPGPYTFSVGQESGDGAYATGSSGQKLSDAAYYWRIRAIDSSGAESAYTNGKDNAIAFGIDTTAPSAPGVPKVSGDTDDTTPTWTWTAASDTGTGLATSDTYTFEWCNNSRFEGCGTAIKTTNTTYTNGALDVTTWFARVKAKDKLDQESSWSEVGIYNLAGTAPSGEDEAPASEESEQTQEDDTVEKVASISLKIVGSDGQPIAGAKTVLYSTPRTAVTNQNGIAIFTDVEVGEHRLIIAFKDKIGVQRLVVEADGTTTSSSSDGENVSAPGQELTVSIQDDEPLIPAVALLAFRIIAAILIMLVYLLHLRRHHDFQYLGKSNDKGIL